MLDFWKIRQIFDMKKLKKRTLFITGFFFLAKVNQLEILFFKMAKSVYYLLTYLQFSVSRWAKVPGPEPN